MKKPTTAKLLQLETQVVRALDNTNLAKVGGASGKNTCVAAYCSGVLCNVCFHI